jgi:polysaccharide export outer membrane protein
MKQQLLAQSFPSFTSRRAAKWLAGVVGLVLTLSAGQCFAQSREALGPGDSVRITVFQNPDLTTETRISERGTVLFPLVGEVDVTGQTPAQASAAIAEQLKKGNFMKNPQVSTAVLTVRSRQVSVLGQVARPGRYALDDTSSKLTDILALAGGIAATGDDNVTAVITRDGKIQRVQVDMPTMYRTGDLSSNIEVQNGDTIFVQRAPVFYIYGEVQRAGAYRVEPNLAVVQAISLGGGLTVRGTERGLKIHRRMSDGTLRILDARSSDTVQSDDVIYVKESLF